MTATEDPHLDGSGMAALLAELAVADLTTLMRTCQSCGDRQAVGAHPAYRGAGVVLRCPACGDVALRIGISDERLTVEWRGTLQVARVPGGGVAAPAPAATSPAE